MRSARIFRKTWARLIALGVCAICAVALVPWTLSDAMLRQTIIRQIESATGLKAEEIGHATLSILPRPSLRFENVTIGDKDGAITIEAKAMKGNLRILSLLSGRLELKSLALDTPTIFIDMDGHPFERVGVIARAFQAAAGTPQADEADQARLANVAIRSGLLRLQSKTLKFETLVQDVDAVLDWQQVGSPALLRGSAVWRGRAAQFELALAKPSAILRGEASNVTLRVQGEAANIDADGVISGAAPQFEGGVKAETNSLRELARMMKFSVPLPGPLDEAWIDGNVKIAGSNIALNDAKLGLDGNSFEGSLSTLVNDGRVALSGTLATDRLQLDPVAGQIPGLRGLDGQWSRDPFDLRALSGDDLDLRISAAHLRLASFQAEDAAVSILVRKNRVEVSLDEAQAYQGAVKLRAVGVIDAPDKLDLKVAGSFSQVDLGGAMVAAGVGDWLSGSGTGEFVLQNSGDSPAALVDSLNGHVALTAAEGAINGINVEQALRRVERRPLLSASDVHSGRTSFDMVRANGAIDRGNLTITDCAISGPGAQIVFDGNVAFTDGSIAINAHAAQTGEDGGKRPGGPELTFNVTGFLDDVRVELDADSLIRRSNAAAPLFVQRRTGVEDLPVSPASSAAPAQ